MESNWRWNVWDYGWGGDNVKTLPQVIEYKYAARLITPIVFGPYVLTWLLGGFNGIFPIGALALEDVPFWLTPIVSVFVAPGGHFPYGYAVDPD